MPVVNTTQARIELSAAQAKALIDVIHAQYAEVEDLPPILFIEETNLGSTVAVGGKGMPWTLIDHRGEAHEMRDAKSARPTGGIEGINSVPCPVCHAKVGEGCTTDGGKKIKGFHKERTRAAR